VRRRASRGVGGRSVSLRQSDLRAACSCCRTRTLPSPALKRTALKRNHQGIRRRSEGGLFRFDHGSDCTDGQACNQKVYGQPQPPSYNLTAITTPLALFTGARPSAVLVGVLPAVLCAASAAPAHRQHCNPTLTHTPTQIIDPVHQTQATATPSPPPPTWRSSRPRSPPGPSPSTTRSPTMRT